MTHLAALYDSDYSLWAQRNAERLRARRFEELDIAHLLEELSVRNRSRDASTPLLRRALGAERGARLA